jgi:catechol 2,3-dioxygenase-like lactoylglutathione lyase family enzyme
LSRFRFTFFVFLLALGGSAACGQVVINELFYAPPDKTKPTEFIELHNAGEAAVDVGGWKFADGVKFTFPAETKMAGKGFVCIAANPAAFEKAFGFAPLGPWEGKLKNGGERVVLADANGGKVDEVAYEVGHPWPTQPHGKGPALELVNARLSRAAAGSWRAGGPTPGKANSVAAENAPPWINEVVHNPPQPKAGVSIPIVARVSDPDGVKSVTLVYQILEPGAYVRRMDEAFEKNWSELPMRDDGLQGDRRAGDGVYTAFLPAQVAVHRRLVRYRIVAEDGKGLRGRAPGPGDSVPNFALFIYDGVPAWSGSAQPGKTAPLTFSPALMETLPTFHLLANAEDVERSQWDGGWNHRDCTGTLVFDGVVYDHVTFHNRGRASTYNTGKNKWGFKFSEGHELAMRDPTGRPLREKWESFSMNGCASPWVPIHRGMAGLDEWFSSRIFELAGVPSPRHVPVQFRVIDRADEAPAKDQYAGDLWGLYLAIEDPDGSFLDERKLTDGSIYTNESGNKKHQAPTQPKDRSDFDQFMNRSRGDQPEAWWRENLDLPAFYSFRAANRITGNVDLREGANHYFYHAPDGHWAPIPWDLDMMLLPKTHQSGRIDQEGALRHEALRIEYGNRCRELLDLLVGDATPRGGQVGQLVAEYSALIQPQGQPRSWAELDLALWNFHPRTNDKGGFYRNPAPDDRFGGRWERKLATADFAGMCRFVLEYASNSRPPNEPWKLNDGDPRGYGFGYLNDDANDPQAPARPAISYAGARGFAANALAFQTSLFQDPQGPATFAALQWRLGQIAGPGIAGWSPGQPRRYEIEPLWTSPEITVFNNRVQIPGHLPRAGLTYRARIRMKDATGRWSRWSEAITFVAGPPVNALR